MQTLHCSFLLLKQAQLALHGCSCRTCGHRGPIAPGTLYKGHRQLQIEVSFGTQSLMDFEGSLPFFSTSSLWDYELPAHLTHIRCTTCNILPPAQNSKRHAHLILGLILELHPSKVLPFSSLNECFFLLTLQRDE